MPDTRSLSNGVSGLEKFEKRRTYQGKKNIVFNNERRYPSHGDPVVQPDLSIPVTSSMKLSAALEKTG